MMESRARGLQNRVQTLDAKAISVITLEPGAGEALRALVAEGKVVLPLRVQLLFSGCMSPILYLCEDSIREMDLTQEIDNLTFIMDPETYRHAGTVVITCVKDRGRIGFVLSPSDPGRQRNIVGVSSLKIRSNPSG